VSGRFTRDNGSRDGGADKRSSVAVLAPPAEAPEREREDGRRNGHRPAPLPGSDHWVDVLVRQERARGPADRARDAATRQMARVAGANKLLLGVLALATLVRLWQINAVGYNSDEAVYGGQGASIANDATLEPYFPTFRAHPLLFQTLLSVGYHLDIGEIFGRLASAAVGVATVYVVYKVAELLYGQKAGLIAALLMAVMPYHVVVTRQVLLDGPMVFFATLTLYLLARHAMTRRPEWLYAAGVGMGLTVLAKESSIVLVGSAYAFFALSPEVRVRLRELVLAGAAMVAVIAVFPISIALAGKTETGGNYLAWQLFRRPNHEWNFYFTEVPIALGLAVVLLAALGFFLLRRREVWKETLLLAWIAVPVTFFQLWPVKGFQYLLPIAPAVAILAARTLANAGQWDYIRQNGTRAPVVRHLRLAMRSHRVQIGLVALATLTLLIPTFSKITPSHSSTFLAGSGGVPGGREAGEWIERNVPEGAQLLTVGPSMANILQYYGHRKAYGLSVSPNPLHRNPAYEPVYNPDSQIRHNNLQYVVWDAFSADRSPFFSANILRYVDRYNGRVVHQETVPVETADGESTRKPIIRIYEVRP
jgi:predicted membrane-bound dolichyl-phosphate-mannose-protein mannosyltransferase